MTLEQVLEELDGILDEYRVVILDGLDNAVIGHTYIMSQDKYCVVYSVSKIVQEFVSRDGMTEEEALEFFNYNTVYTDCVFVYD